MRPRQNRSRKGGQRKRKKLVLVFGEDENDTRAIRELLIAIVPELEGFVKPLARPPILMKDATLAKLPSRAQVIAALIDVENASADVVCVFAHEDCDALEPAHNALANKIETAMAEKGYHVHAVAPAWEIETWWFQWPGAVQQVRSGWRGLEGYKNRDLGKIEDAKEELRRALRPQGRTAVRDYSETDGPRIAEAVRRRGDVHTRQGKSASFDRFLESAAACGAKFSL